MVYDWRRFRPYFTGLWPPYRMSLVGNLEDLGLGEILQIVSLSRKSGTLRLHSRGREGVVVFRLGQVIQATSSTVQESLGEALIRRGALDLATLRSALALQESGESAERLGTVLVKHFAVSAAVVEEVVREQIEKVVYALFAWIEGTFDFELKENVEAVDAVRLDPMQFMLDQGLNPQFLAMEGARIADEQRRNVAAAPEPEPGNHVSADGAFDFPVPPERSTPERTPKGDLILVDDDDATREALTAILQRAGYRVHPFSRSEEAFIQTDALCRQGEHPFLLVDLIMPRMDGSGILGGLELLERARGSFPDLRLLVVSDYPNSDAERRVGELGYSYIMKPRRTEFQSGVEPEGFAEKLLAGIEQVASGGEPAAPADLVNLGDELRLELGEEFAEQAGRQEPQTGIAMLRGMLEELNDPALGGGITLLALRFAAEFVSRAVIFMAMREEIVGLGQFGLTEGEGPADARVRRLRIPRGEQSLFTGIIEAKHPAVVRPEPLKWNRYLFAQLGGGTPDEVFLGPIVSEGKVVAVLYGDNLPERRPIGGTESLEIFLSQAGIAMEKALLERKLMESSRGGT